MYSLYDIFSSRNKILSSIGLEYSDLDYNSLILILISDVKSYNMFDKDSNNVISNPQFYQLLEATKYNQNTYLLDTILLRMNDRSSQTLIQLHSTKSVTEPFYKDMMFDIIVPNEIQQQILLYQTDIDTIISMNCTSSYYHNILNDPKFIKKLIDNISNSNLKPLPGRIHYTLISTNFAGFVDWYQHMYYTKHCYKYANPCVCYIGAINANDQQGADKYYNKLDDYEFWTRDRSVGYVAPRQLLDLINSKKDKLNDYDIFGIEMNSLESYPCGGDLTDDDIDVFSQFISFISNYVQEEGIDEDELQRVLLSSIEDVRLFKLEYDALLETNASLIDVLKNEIVNLDSYMGTTDNYYKFIKCIENVTDGNIQQIISIQDLSKVISEYVVVGNDYLDDNQDYTIGLTKLLDLISSHIGYEKLNNILKDTIMTKINNNYYSNIISSVRDYINNNIR